MLKIKIDKKLHGANGEMNLDVDLIIKQGEFVALTGKSGAGKSTLLRILAGLEEANGVIHIGEKVWQDETTLLPPQKRNIGFVFQNYALFPNMTIEQNLLFVQKDKKLATKLLTMTELLALKNRRPHDLSGGQQQRVSLCRALMNRPKLLLMDEPLSALDPKMRTKLQDEIVTLHKEFGTTTIMISHEPSEMYRMSSRVIVLELGKVVEDGRPKEVLFKNNHSKKFSFNGKILEIKKENKKSIAIISMGQQLIEIILDERESKTLTVGQSIQIGTENFSAKIL